MLNEGGVPIYEPGLDRLIGRNLSEGRLRFTTDVDEAARHGQVIFIAVGTPPGEEVKGDWKQEPTVDQFHGQGQAAEELAKPPPGVEEPPPYPPEWDAPSKPTPERDGQQQAADLFRPPATEKPKPDPTWLPPMEWHHFLDALLKHRAIKWPIESKGRALHLKDILEQLMEPKNRSPQAWFKTMQFLGKQIRAAGEDIPQAPESVVQFGVESLEDE